MLWLEHCNSLAIELFPKPGLEIFNVHFPDTGNFFMFCTCWGPRIRRYVSPSSSGLILYFRIYKMKPKLGTAFPQNILLCKINSYENKNVNYALISLDKQMDVPI